MTGAIFVDTNVFLYVFDPADTRKQIQAHAWREELWKNRRGRISFQVLQEFYVKATKKWPESRREIQDEITDLLTWQPVTVDAEILDRGWKLEDRYQLSFWDALIVAAAASAGCRYLLTEDLQNGQDLDGVLVMNPFLTSPSALAVK